MEHDRPVGGRIRRLLVCFDGSAESNEATELALDLGRSLGAELTVFSVLPDTSHLETDEARHAAERAVRDRLDRDLDGIRAHATSVGVPLREATAPGGGPADTIARFADEHGFDLILIGSHGRERVTHGGLGRVVERLLGDPRCPVLVAAERFE